MANARPQEQQEGSNIANIADFRCVSVDLFPKEVISWLKKYGLTNEEVLRYGLKFNPRKGELVIPVGDGVFQTRAFPTTRGPKYLTFGMKNAGPLPIFGVSDSDTLIFVEDVISAIKVGRIYATCPILGAHINKERFIEASKRFKYVGVWLDSDKLKEGWKLSNEASAYVSTELFRVFTENDPKTYGDEFIRSVVEAAKGN